MLTSRIHCRTSVGKPMPRHFAQENPKKSSIRAIVEYVLAHQQNRFGLFVRILGLHAPRASWHWPTSPAAFGRLIFHERRRAMG
jgi:transposase, IS5 family